MFRYVFIGALCLFGSEVASGQMSGQNAQRALRGLKTIALVVDGIDEAAKYCGISRQLIRDAFLFPVSQSKIKFSEDLTNQGSNVMPAESFYIRVDSLVQRNPHQCVTSLSLAVVSYQKVNLDFANGPATWAAVRLWEDDWLSVSAADRHPQQIRTAVENSTKKFLTVWNLGNTP